MFIYVILLKELTRPVEIINLIAGLKNDIRVFHRMAPASAHALVEKLIIPYCLTLPLTLEKMGPPLSPSTNQTNSK